MLGKGAPAEPLEIHAQRHPVGWHTWQVVTVIQLTAYRIGDSRQLPVGRQVVTQLQLGTI